ncbi:MAG TPA: acyltransferase [Flavipsychrobacter sp.]|nr:acyltransferase [Flavipsychrobacter sp.]
MPGTLIRNIFGLRKDMEISFYITDFLFRKIMRQNAGVKWAIHHTSTIRCPQYVKRGKGSYPGDSPNVYIDANNGVEIGAHVNIGPGVGIISSNHNFINNEIADAAPPIKIGDFCWLGIHATVLPGVELGNFTIVGSNAVVTKSFKEGYMVLAGNPAKIIRHLDKAACETFARTKN